MYKEYIRKRENSKVVYTFNAIEMKFLAGFLKATSYPLKAWVLVTHTCNPSYLGRLRSGGWRFQTRQGK
jgi:hypothetical protein